MEKSLKMQSSQPAKSKSCGSAAKLTDEQLLEELLKRGLIVKLVLNSDEK